MGRWGRGGLLALLLLVVLGAALAAYSDADALGEALQQLDWGPIGLALALALGNYLVRFARWHYYLGCLSIRVSVMRSMAIFFAGLVMSMTPGKVGELLKSYLLKNLEEVPVSRSAPVVLAERFTDLIAVVILCLLGVTSARYGLDVVIIGAALCAIGLVVIAWRPLRARVLRLISALPGVGRYADSLQRAFDSMTELIRVIPFGLGIALGLLAWGLECVAFYVLLDAFPGVEVSLGLASFIYAMATLAGALSMLPGGLILTEGSMIAMLTEVFRLTPSVEIATAVTLVTRFCTLWFAILLGVGALAGLKRAFGSSVATAPDPPN